MNFKQLPNGKYEGFVILKKCEEKTTRNGSPYLDLIIGDKDGEMFAKYWEYTTPGLFQTDMIVKISGTIKPFNGKDQFVVSKISPVNSDDNYNLSELIPSSDVGGEQLFNMIKNRVNKFEDEDLKAIVNKIIDDRRDKLVTCPAALRLHHAMLGGLMYHTMSIVRMAEEICKVYTNIDKDLLLSGIILHDVAKTWEFETGATGLATGYSVEGELIGHLVKGAMYIDEAAKELGITSDRVFLLEHMVLSHHGVPEYGSPIRPMFLEAIILSALDTLDAEIYEVNDATSKVDPHSFTDRQWALDNRKLYNHGLASTEHRVNFGE